MTGPRPAVVNRLRHLYTEHDAVEQGLREMKRANRIHGIVWTLSWRYHDDLERRIIDAQAAATAEELTAAEQET